MGLVTNEKFNDLRRIIIILSYNNYHYELFQIPI
jgi:hypothetical protein